MQFLTPWYEDGSTFLAEELGRETPADHVLQAVPVVTLARRRDKDCVLFALKDGTSRVAVVHLTYATETDPRWPRANLFESVEDWLVSMAADHADFVA